MAEFARVSTLEVAADKIDDATAFFSGTDLAGASSAPGFRRGFWLLDRSTGKGAEVLIFDSPETREASTSGEDEAQGSAGAAGVKFARPEVYEVVAEGKPGA